MLRLWECGMGHCTDRLKDKSKEKTCIKGGKQTVRKTLRSLSFLFYSPSPSFVLESHSVSKLETHHT